MWTPATIARINAQFHLPQERTEVQSDFHDQNQETAHTNKVVVALAAKIARIIWALLRHKRVFESPIIMAN
jgi:hypothetical protein